MIFYVGKNMDFTLCTENFGDYTNYKDNPQIPICNMMQIRKSWINVKDELVGKEYTLYIMYSISDTVAAAIMLINKNIDNHNTFTSYNFRIILSDPTNAGYVNIVDVLGESRVTLSINKEIRINDMPRKYDCLCELANKVSKLFAGPIDELDVYSVISNRMTCMDLCVDINDSVAKILNC